MNLAPVGYLSTPADWREWLQEQLTNLATVYRPRVTIMEDK